MGPDGSASQLAGRVFTFELSTNPIDTASLTAAFDDEGAGACVVFEGRVRNRNEGRPVDLLEYEAYPQMALAEGKAILAEASQRFAVIGARCIHRLGRLEIGNIAVWVAVLAEHRHEGFAACRYIIDEVKSRVPIWKKEHYIDGDAAWVAPEPENR
ncbi:MAG TPA: molybdenum cofactor biosynthesis protein MoaE [Spirochaetia bacterium]|nr:molybdenum cofactor biosynthesis protein MoaE [Spirochaetia bacterium]